MVTPEISNLSTMLKNVKLHNYEYRDRYIGHERVVRPGYIRIGDSIFQCPPTDIHVGTQSENYKVPILRSSNAQTLMTGRSNKYVTIELMFSGLNNICGVEKSVPFWNGSKKVYVDAPHPNTLRALVAQFRRCPVIPVSNDKLVRHGVYALSLLQLDIETVPQYPELLKATIVATPFDWQHCLPTPHFLEEWFVWPVYRWHWRNEYVNPDESAYTKYVNSSPDRYDIDWNSDTRFFIADSIDLQRRQVTRESMDMSQATAYKITEKDINMLEVKGISNKFVITQIKVSLQNEFSSMTLLSEDNPFPQYMGGVNAQVAMSGSCSDSDVSVIEGMFRATRDNVRKYHFEIVSGFMKIDNPLLNMLNLCDVIPESDDGQTMRSYPGMSIFNFKFSQFNKMQSAYEQFTRMKTFMAYNFKNKYVDFSTNQLKTIAGAAKQVFSNTSMIAFASIVNNIEYIDQTNVSSRLDSAFEGPFAEAGFIQTAFDSMRMMELYPDLHLPEYELLYNSLEAINEDYLRHSAGNKIDPLIKLSAENVSIGVGISRNNNSIASGAFSNKENYLYGKETTYEAYTGVTIKENSFKFNKLNNGGNYVDPDFYIQRLDFSPMQQALIDIAVDNSVRYLEDLATNQYIGKVRLGGLSNTNYGLNSKIFEDMAIDSTDIEGLCPIDIYGSVSDSFYNLGEAMDKYYLGQLFGTNNKPDTKTGTNQPDIPASSIGLDEGDVKSKLDKIFGTQAAKEDFKQWDNCVKAIAEDIQITYPNTADKNDKAIRTKIYGYIDKGKGLNDYLTAPLVCALIQSNFKWNLYDGNNTDVNINRFIELYAKNFDKLISGKPDDMINKIDDYIKQFETEAQFQIYKDSRNKDLRNHIYAYYFARQDYIKYSYQNVSQNISDAEAGQFTVSDKVNSYPEFINGRWEWPKIPKEDMESISEFVDATFIYYAIWSASEMRELVNKQSKLNVKPNATNSFMNAGNSTLNAALNVGNRPEGSGALGFTGYDGLIIYYANLEGVDPLLIKAIMTQESAFDPNATSSAGACGLMQLMPETAAELGVTDIKDPEQNIMGGVKYISQMIRQFGSIDGALAAYNGGPGEFERQGRNLNNMRYETRMYVPKVLGYYNELKKSGASTYSNTTDWVASLISRKNPDGSDVGSTPKANKLTPSVDNKERLMQMMMDKGMGQEHRDFQVDEVIQAGSPLDHSSEFTKFFGHYVDLIEQNSYGRLVSVFPTFCVVFIDEGDKGWFKRFQPIFNKYSGVSQISIARDRREPDVLQLEVTNAYRTIASYKADQAIANMNYRESWLTMLNPFATWDIFFWSDWNKKRKNFIYNNRDKDIGAIMMRPGARVHVRLGNGSNAMELPIAFNGTITEFQPAGDVATIYAHGDGVELTKKLPVTDPNTTLGNSIWGWEARELICHMLMSGGSKFGDYWNDRVWNYTKSWLSGVSGGRWFSDNPLGIKHFGSPVYFDMAKVDVKSLDPIQETYLKFNNILNNLQKYIYDLEDIKSMPDSVVATAVGSVCPTIGVGVLHLNNVAHTIHNDIEYAKSGLNKLKEYSDAVSQLVAGKNPYALVNFLVKEKTGKSLFEHHLSTAYDAIKPYVHPTCYKSVGEIGENIYSTTNYEDKKRPASQPSVRENIYDFGFMGRWDFGLDMKLYDRTPLDIIKLCADVFPNYTYGIRPFEFRSTLFFGKTHYDMRYSYRRVGLADCMIDSNLIPYYGVPMHYVSKPFSQVHMAHSNFNLINNNIYATEDKMCNQVVARWYENADSKANENMASETQYVSKTIYPERRKTHMVDTNYVGVAFARKTATWIQRIFYPMSATVTDAENFIFKNTVMKSIGNAYLGYYYNKEKARMLARSILRDYVREMYQGSMTTLGDATVWPEDKMYIFDQYNDMRGMSLVRKNNIHFSKETGFVNVVQVSPYAYVKGDFKEMEVGAMGMTIGTLATYFSVCKLNAYLARLGIQEFNALVVNILSIGAPYLGLYEARTAYLGLVDNAGKVLTDIQKDFLGTIDKALYDKTYFPNGANILDAKGIELLKSKEEIDVIVRSLPESVRNADDLKAIHQLASTMTAEEMSTLLKNYQVISNLKTVPVSQTLTGIEGIVGNLVSEQVNLSIANNLIKEPVLLKSGVLNMGDGLFDIASRTVIGEVTEESLKVTTAAVINAEIVTLASSGSLAKNILGIIARGPFTVLGSVVGSAIPGIGTVAGTIIGAVIDNLLIYMLLSVPIKAWNRYWDDQYSLDMSLLMYRGQEFSAGINGHSLNVGVYSMRQNPNMQKYTGRGVTYMEDIDRIMTYSGTFQPGQVAKVLDNTFGGRSDVVSAGYKYLGLPYVFGAEGPSSFDCSSFTLQAYKDVGIEIPRRADYQYDDCEKYGFTKVLDRNFDISKLQPGDLVFFSGTYGNFGDGITHVGIYEGNGKFMHASSSKGIVNGIDLSSYVQSVTFAGACRYTR